MKQTFFFQMERNTNQVMGKVFVRDRDNGQTHYYPRCMCGTRSQLYYLIPLKQLKNHLFR